MRELNISDHFSELNRAVFEDSSEYASYFNFLKDAFESLMNSFDERSTDDPIEVNVLKSYIQRFLNTVEALSMRYRNEQEHFPKIDLTESSFPNAIEIKKLGAELGRAQEELDKLPTMKALKQSTLDYIFEKENLPGVLIDQMYRRAYLELLNEQKLFLEYSPGDIVPIPNEEGKENLFLYTWGSYDITFNRPFVYILIFELDKSRNVDDPQLQTLFKKMIKDQTQNTAPLRVMAYEIDNMSEFVRPKVLKRIDLGPIYSKYSKDETELCKLVQGQFNGQGYAFKFTNEIIFSIGQKKAKGFLSSGQVRQIFFIDESNKEAIERHVSKVLKYLMAPHDIIQHIHSYRPELIKDLAADPISV